ncbi:hypothetical protein ColTof3_14564 [Colletotrichum tofieldiae]|nr:hypothetical protein ColTof3_14564 [Colletotrichum tofieldiae]
MGRPATDAGEEHARKRPVVINLLVLALVPGHSGRRPKGLPAAFEGKNAGDSPHGAIASHPVLTEVVQLVVLTIEGFGFWLRFVWVNVDGATDTMETTVSK